MQPDGGARPVGIALLGCGRMGAAHLEALRETAALRLVAVVDPALDPACGLPLRSLDDALASSDVEAVLVATPTTTHASLVQVALERGLHVLCEKPMTLDPETDRALGRAAQVGGRVLQVGFWRRFAAPYRAMREALVGGAIGAPRAVRAAQWDAALPPLKFCDPASSGGLEIDCGVHEFDVARWLLRTEIGALHALAPPPRGGLGELGDIDSALALAALGSGVPLAIDLARTVGGTDTIRTEIVGSEGALVLEIAGEACLTLRNGRGSGTETFPGDAIAKALRAQARAFAAAVRAGQADPEAAGAEDARAALVVARAMRAARLAAPVGADAHV